MTENLAWLLIGFSIAGCIRIVFGRLTIYTASEGWVWRWSRFDEDEQRLIERWNEGYLAGLREEQCRRRMEKQPCPKN